MHRCPALESEASDQLPSLPNQKEYVDGMFARGPILVKRDLWPGSGSLVGMVSACPGSR